ncbi:nucleoporin2-domain-containing protein [Phanerochaete sordida]|uniref:Nucleoporin2-domain-containing protein n=1 Tax=Phanerochaete sordida TaxID=48140 RepID=A0A9P3L9N9_9APHY|nr:nucleoporin2-domain-containing protein [Phanerochaete sordida]
MFGNTSITSSWGQPQQQPQQQGNPAFGQPAASGFGTGTFGSGGAFGQQQQPQQQPQANPMFGGLGGAASTSTATPATTGFGAFGANNAQNTATGLFGAPKPNTGFGAFGGGATTGGSSFGGTGAFGTNTAGASTGTGLFGQNNASTSTGSFGGGGLFGAKPAGSTFGTTSTANNAAPAAVDGVPPVTTGSSNPPYNAFSEKDAGATNVVLHYQSISCMPAYRGTSFEELRWQDYQQGRKTAGAFSQQSFGAPAAQPTTGTGLFGQPAAPAAAQPSGSVFGSFGNNTTPAATGTGAFGAFGQPAASTTAPATGTGLFGGGAFGQQQQQQPQQPQQQTGAFGAFGQPQQPQQPQQQPQPTAGGLFGGGAFGAQNQQPKPFGAFGGAGTAAAPGTTGGFGAFGQAGQTQQPATGTGLFGQQQQQQQQQQQAPGGFGAFGQPNQQKPGLFGQQQPQPTGAFGTFGNAGAQPAQQQGAQQPGGLFGGGAGATGTGLFGGAQQPAQQQAGAGGLFGQQQPQQPAAGGLFGGANTNAGGGLFGGAQNNQQAGTQQTTGGFGLFGQNKPATAAAPSAGGGLFGSFGQQSTTANQPQQQTGGLFGTTQGQNNAQPATGGFGLFGKPAATQPAQSAGTGFGGSIFGSTLGGSAAPAGQPAAQQPQLTASIAQPIGANLPIFSMLPPGPRAITLDQPRKKTNIFLEVPTRTPVPRIQLGYTPATSKLRGYTSTAQAQGLGASVSLTSGKPGALALSQKSLLGPDAALNGTGPSPGLGSSTRHSVKKLILDKKVEPSDLMKSSAQKSMFNPALSIAAREYEAAMAQRGPDTPTPASKASTKPTTNKFSAQPTHESVKESEKAPDVSELKEGDYYVKPSLGELKKYSFGELSAVKGLVVGRVGYGEIEFLEPVDLTGLRRTTELLGDIVRFDDKECSVYPDLDDADKPPPGAGLNVRARITLVHCWALDKATREPIKDEKHPHAVRHLKRLKNMKNTAFESFDIDAGKWVFAVEHF